MTPPPPPPPFVNKTLVVIVGGSSGLGFEALKSLLQGPIAYHIVLGIRRPLKPENQSQLNPLLAKSHSSLDLIPVDFSQYGTVRTFADTIKSKYAGKSIDALVLCASQIEPGKISKDRENDALQVNVLSHALLVDLLDSKIGENGTKTRVLFVEDESHRNIQPYTVEPSNIDKFQDDPKTFFHIARLLMMYLFFFAQERFADRPNVSIVAVSPSTIRATPTPEASTGYAGRLLGWAFRTSLGTPIGIDGATVARGITGAFPSGANFSQNHPIVYAAEECYDPEQRLKWKNWFVDVKKVWHHESDSARQALKLAEEFAEKARIDEQRREYEEAVQAPVTAPSAPAPVAVPAPVPVPAPADAAPPPPPKDTKPKPKSVPTPTASAPAPQPEAVAKVESPKVETPKTEEAAPPAYTGPPSGAASTPAAKPAVAEAAPATVTPAPAPAATATPAPAAPAPTAEAVPGPTPPAK